jgi:photoactive yellow protein
VAPARADTSNMANENVTAAALAFGSAGLCAKLDAWSDDAARYDELDFGLIAMDLDGTIVAYNRCEGEFASVSPHNAIGLIFFCDVAPCTNNYLVSGRFDAASELDETIDYVFTVKMRPRAVQLRLLKNQRSGRQYVAVKW